MPAASRSSATALRMLARRPVSSAENGSSSSIRLRLPGERAGQRHALLLAAGELVRAARQRSLGSSPTISQQLRRCAARRPASAVEAEADVVGDAQMREQRAVLRHEADAAPCAGTAAGAVGQQLAVERDAARRRAPRSRRSGAAAWSCRSPTGRRSPCGCRPATSRSTPSSAATAP